MTPLAPALARLPSQPIRPVYPVRRSRKLVRFTLALVIASIVAGASVVAYPAMLDPLVDDYEWFGSDYAQLVRAYARDAHAAIAGLIADL